ncbi:hypothetical protein DXB56_12440 [Clostridium sp. OM04-7]|uniref:hypothetical protein n=1 Tax=Clostridium sp. OM04-7 TaxID=2293042 RepID=UPI000E4AAB3D|nr:hypothetical protein [Clostridium sp. OM04-7]RHV30910.1 hypothetical protein DXB56_12440 [Clostridium sp. OM04-7]
MADGTIVIDTAIRKDGLDAGINEIEQALDGASAQFHDYGDSVQKFIDDYMNGAGQASRYTNELKQQVESLKKQLKDLEDNGKWFGDEDYNSTFLKYQQLMQEVKEWKRAIVNPESDVKLFDSSTLEGQIGKLTGDLMKLRNSGKGFGDETFDATAIALKRAQHSLADYQKELFKTDEQRQKEAETARKQEEAQRRVNERLEEARQKEAAAAQEAARLSAIGENAKISNRRIVSLNKELAALEARQKELSKAGVGPGNKEYDSNARKIRKLREELSRYQSGAKASEKQTKKLNKSLDNTKKSAGGARMSMKRMLMMSLMFSTVFRALSAVASGLKSGTDNLAQYSDDTNRALSMLVSALTQLKNSFATAFSPAIEYAAPALTKMISLLSEAVTWAAQLAAALTGKDTYTRATKVEEDYGAALKESNQQLKDKEKLNKKLLFSFDELIQAQKNSSDTKDYVGPTPDQMFKTEEVPNEMKDLAADIKKTFSDLFDPLKESWKENGPEVTKAVKAAFTAMKQLAGDVGASFMQVWNMEGYGKRITDDLLITVANLAWTVANLATQLDAAWVAGDTGTNIMRHLGDIILEITGFFRDASQSMKDWSADLDFSPLLTSFDAVFAALGPVVGDIGDALLWLLNKCLLPLAKWGLESGLPAVFDLIAAALTALHSVLMAAEPTFDWMWNDFFQPIGQWTGELIIGALQKLTQALLRFSDWASQHKSTIQALTEVVIMFFAAWAVTTLVSHVGLMIANLGKLIGVLATTNIKFLAIVTVLTAVAGLAMKVAQAWTKMTPGERLATKIIAVAGAIALVVAAIGALTSNYVMLGVAMAVAGIAGLGISSIVSSANSRSGNSRPNTASAYQNANRAVSYASAPFRMPRLATGTVVPPRAGEFAAILGDNKRETEVVSPLSTMKQALKEALEESGAIGGGRDIHIDLILNGQRFASAVYKANNQERQRVGVRMVQQNA